jgi:potassium-transporting ATPase KdpC subunit
MNLIGEILKALRVSFFLWILVAVIYPLGVLAMGQGIFPYQAQGSLLKNAQGDVVGSALIGQPFESDRYFWGRPSAIRYSTARSDQDPAGILKTGISGGSNLAPTNPILMDRITQALDRLELAGDEPTIDLLYASGSGLDPHITPAAALGQINRIAQARNLNPNQLEILIQTHTEGRFLGIFGEPGVNVLRLNLALDGLAG